MAKLSLETLKNTFAQGSDILDREDYVSTAIIVPLVLLHGEEQILFEQRAAHIRQGHEICFPGGHFDHKTDISYLATALRETQEELGIDPETFEILGHLGTLLTPRGIIVECFVGYLELADLDELTIDKKEVEEAFTIPVSWFAGNPPEIFHTRIEIQSSYIDDRGQEQILLPVEKLGLPPRYADNRSEWLHRVIVYNHPEYLIWGLTGTILYNLVNRLSSENGDFSG